MKHIEIRFFWFGLLVWSFLPLTAQTPVQVGEGDRLFVGKNLEYFRDTTGSLGIEDVLNQSFTPNETDALNLGFTDHTVWMRFSVVSDSGGELFMEINSPMLSHLEVYNLTSGSPQLLFSGGASVPYEQRPVKTENWLLEVNLERGIPSTYYVKGRSYYPFQVPIVVSTKNKFVERNMRHNLFWGIYIGVMLFAFIYNLFVYTAVRERYYLYYLAYVLITSGFYLGLEGFGFQFVWPGIPEFNPLIPVLVSITNVLIVLFTLDFLQIKRDQKVLYWWGWATIGLNALAGVIDLAGMYTVALPLSQLVSMLASIYFIVAGVVSLRRGIKTAKYFLMAWSAFLVMVIIFILQMNNVVPSNFFTSNGIYLGHMTEVVLLSFALADRINLLKLENENKQKEIITHLRENQQLQTKVNRELEQKVQERTAEVVAQKERSEELLLNILPVAVADELKANGKAEAKQINQVTVLFTDFKEFTALAEQLSATELVEELNYCFSEFDKIMQKYGIEKIKTIGDAYMAAGGLPVPNQTHATDVVNASLEIQQFMQEYRKSRAAAGQPYFETRIGVHTGSVVAGIVGLKKFAYDIWGDTVNIASRMESSGKTGKINISQTTYELVKDTFQCEPRGKITAKGKGELDMYFVESRLN